MLKIKNLEYGTREGEILRGVSLEAGAGEVTGIIGPGGCGKTTLLRAITGAVKPRRGQISLQGDDLLAMSERERARWVAVVEQEPDLVRGLTAERVVRSGPRACRSLLDRDSPEDGALVERVLERLELLELRRRGFDSLSSGERQRVLLARALAQDAPLLLLDGVGDRLDVSARLALPGLIRRTGRTVLAVFQDLELAARCCDRLYALKDGQVMAAGRTELVLTPELLRRLYGAEARVVRDEDGIMVRFRNPVPVYG